MAWLLWQDHYLTVQVFSRSDNAAKRFVRVVRNFLRHPLCWSICPDNDEHVADSQVVDGAFGFILPPALGHLGASLSLMCSGITSTGITGSRAHLVVMDDIESSADGNSDTRREQLLERTEEVDHLLHPKTRERMVSNKVVALGTPQVGLGRSIYARWLKQGATIEDWEKTDAQRRAGLWQVFTARMFREHEEQNEKTGTRYTRLESLWRDRFTEDDLEAKRSMMSARNWKLHWCIDLGLEDDINDRPLRWSDAIVFDWPEDKLLFPRKITPGGERLKHLGPFEALGNNDGLFGPRTHSAETSAFVATICTVDPSSGMKNRDATGLCFLGVTATGVAVVRRLIGVRGESANDTLLSTAAEIARMKPTKVVVEATAQSLYPGSLETALARQGFRTRVEATSARKNKADRIGDALGAALATNKLVFLEAVFKTDCAADVVHQLADFSYSLKYLDHDDIIDALAWSLIIAREDRLLKVEEAEAFDTFTQERREELLRLSPRQGGITEGGPEDELFFQNHQEEIEITQRRLELALEDSSGS